MLAVRNTTVAIAVDECLQRVVMLLPAEQFLNGAKKNVADYVA